MSSSRHISSRVLVELCVGIVGVVAAFFGWQSVGSALSGADELWAYPIFWFSISAIAILSGGILYERKAVRATFAAALLLPSLFFTATIPHLALTLLGIALVLAAFGKMRENMDSRLVMSFRRSMGIGSFLIVFSISLLIASQYYAAIRASSWQDLVPRFSLAEGGGDAALRIAGMLSPELDGVRDSNTTVDEFLLSIRSSDEHAGAPLPVNAIEEMLSLEAGRLELGKLVGRNVSGTERMGDVFSEALHNKTVAFLSAAKAERDLPNSVLSSFLALLLFITVLSVGSFLRIAWIPLAAGFVRMLIATGALSVEKVPAEREVLR